MTMNKIQKDLHDKVLAVAEYIQHINVFGERTRKFYAGIGSRETPSSLKLSIKRIALALEKMGYTLRSGGAEGADTFFEKHVKDKEIYLPWKDYNGNKSPLYGNTPEWATQMALEYHPNYARLTDGAKKMMDRNSMQIFGDDQSQPVEFVVCWTKDGKASGGTGQAMRIARGHGIKIFNLYNKSDVEELDKFLSTPSLF